MIFINKLLINKLGTLYINLGCFPLDYLPYRT